MVDGNDPVQLAMVAKSIHHQRVRRTLLQGLSQAKGYANHTFNEVFVGGPELREHRVLTISRAYWADEPDAHATIKESKWLFHNDGSRSILVHAEEWFDGGPGPQYRPFLESAGKQFVFKADGHPEVHGRITTSSITWQSRNLHEIEIIIPREQYANMKPAVQYTIVPPNDVSGYEWKIKEPVTIMKKP